MTDRLCALALLFSFDLSDNFSTEGDLGHLGGPPPPPSDYFQLFSCGMNYMQS